MNCREFILPQGLLLFDPARGTVRGFVLANNGARPRILFVCLRFNLKSHFIDENFALFKREVPQRIGMRK